MDTETRSVVVEREMPHPAEKIWRALTQAPLIEDWLMSTDFQPEVGHRFYLRTTPSPHWNGLLDCEVLEVEPPSRLAYTWNSTGEHAGLQSVVTWTLTPTSDGTHVRMEQSGFRPDQTANLQGAQYGWTRFMAGLAQVVDALDAA